MQFYNVIFVTKSNPINHHLFVVCLSLAREHIKALQESYQKVLHDLEIKGIWVQVKTASNSLESSTETNC